jgi:hypothetical protein
MSPRALLRTPLILGLVVSLWTPLFAGPAGPEGKAAFDLEARKRARAWMWESPRRQAIPEVADPGWAGSAVDRFLRHRLEKAGLNPAPPVDDRTWLRRAHFAVTGLPPTAGEIHRFLSDRESGAREREVDRLLASPHFGERWARHWMDLMRYAETRGHESDYAIANAWQYRDYLLRAFNADVPYDRFLQEHLAGDLLPEPRLRPGTESNESVLATGWPFLGEEVHSPVDIRQDECERLDNKVDVFTKSFLGLTVSCARCHDHKFDPIRTDDYYGLVGFLLSSSFRQVRFEASENNRQGAVELAGVRARLLPKAAAAAGAALRPGIAGLSRSLAGAEGSTNHWTTQVQSAATNPVHVLHRYVRLLRRQGTPERSPSLPAGARIIADFTRPGVQPWKADGEAFGSGPVTEGMLLPGSTASEPLRGIASYGAARRDPFWNRLRNSPGNEDDSGRLGATARAGRMLRTPTVTLGAGKLHYLLRGRAKVYAAVESHLMLDGPLHGVLTQTFDSGAAPAPVWFSHDLSAYAGHRTHLEFGPEGDRDLEILQVVESAETPSVPLPPVLPPELEQAGSAADFASALETSARAACDWLEKGAPLPAPVGIPAVADWLVRNPELLGARLGGTPAATALAEAQEDVARRIRWESRTAVALFDGTGVDEFVLVRGKPLKPGSSAPRGLPAAFASPDRINPAEGSGRLELGRRLADPENPLVARVMVNRMWHHLFGRGLVPTVDNFGALGEAPTHPELLDHLAWQFVHEDAWSMKRMIRRLVLTQAFAMGNGPVDARAREIDPVNALWHHRPVRRLEAEAIRDSLLVVSGRFNPVLGGPPVPVFLDEFVVGRGRPDKSGSLDGDGRRTFYTAVRRNFLSPTQVAFDFPTPFSTVGRRNVTNVPSQGLARMNDPLFRQQAGVWATRLLRETPGAPPAARIAWLFESAYGRLPTPEEGSDCLASLDELRAFHPADNHGVEAWTDLAHALLNANEFIYVP